MNKLKQALEYATAKHAGQTRKDGKTPFIVHPIRVALMCDTSFERIIALLHDTVEDTDATIEEIKDLFGKDVAEYVDLLTHKKGDSYKKYLKLLPKYGRVPKVKKLDILDNLRDDPSDRMIEKAGEALLLL